MANDKESALPDSGMSRFADLLDTRFRIPGTKITFGLDFILGLIPGAGDMVGFALSSALLLMMVTRGASGRALAIMILNILLDTTLGSIPLFGNVFDLFFKANKRNLDLFQDHFEEGKHQGSAWPVILGVMATLLILLVFIGWLIFVFLRFLFSALF